MPQHVRGIRRKSSGALLVCDRATTQDQAGLQRMSALPGRLWAVRGRPTTTDDDSRRQPFPCSAMVVWVQAQAPISEAELRKVREDPARREPLLAGPSSHRPRPAPRRTPGACSRRGPARNR